MNITSTRQQQIIGWLQEQAAECEDDTALKDAAIDEFKDDFAESKFANDAPEYSERLTWLEEQASIAFSNAEEEEEEEDDDEDDDVEVDDTEDEEEVE